MSTGELLTRGTIWLALVLHVAGEIAAPLEGRGARVAAHRWLKTIGGVAFLAHLACAFHFHHGWSHAAAYAETARQTAELTGWSWGGGLYINYAFALVWVADVVGSWIVVSSPGARPRWWTWLVRGIFLFMMVNGAVVFAHGAGRWLGSVLCLILAAGWIHRARRGADLAPASAPP